MRLLSPVKLKDIAAIIDADFEGNPDSIVSGISEIHYASAGELTFVDHPKYYKKALESGASFVIINKKVEDKNGKELIYSDDPFRDYNILVRTFSGFNKSLDLISLSAEIGEATIIQPGAFIGNNVKIGRNSIIHANVSIYDNCVIGNNVIIHSGTVIGADAFYYKRRPAGYDKLVSCGSVEIEDDVEIGANCTIDRGVSSITRIGKGSKLDNLIQVGHDTVIGKNCLFASQVGIAGTVVIEDDVILWGQVGVHKDLRIGKGVVVLGQSGIGKDLEAGKVYFGSPVLEAREKMKELVYLKRLPELFAINNDDE